MKTAIIMHKDSYSIVIDQKTIDRLSTYGELVIGEGSTKEQVIAAAKGADVLITSWGNEPIDSDILAVCPDLKLVCHAAGSVKPIVSDELWQKGVRVTSSACCLSMGVSETALGFTIAACKNLFNLNTSLHAGGWQEGKENIRELYDLTVGIVGFGWAGRHYCELLAPFDVKKVIYDPFASKEAVEALGATLVSFEELLKISDVVSIHAPSIDSTYHMFNAETLAMMKPDAVLINTARGTLIDEKALYDHMKAGNLKYACLDVRDPEPPAEDDCLRELPNCIMSPHLAGLAKNGLYKIGKHVCDEIDRYLAGEKMIGEVTKEMLANMA